MKFHPLDHIQRGGALAGGSESADCDVRRELLVRKQRSENSAVKPIVQISNLIRAVIDEQEQIVIPRAHRALELEVKRRDTGSSILDVTDQRGVSLFVLKRKDQCDESRYSLREIVEATADRFDTGHVRGGKNDYDRKLAHCDRLA